MLLNLSESVGARWQVRGVTLVVWAAALASVVFWGLRLSGPSTGPQAAVMPAAVAPVDSNQVARALGARAQQVVTVAAPNRFALAGVIAGAPHGAALISIDGQPAKPFRVGSALEPELLLQSVSPRRAVLARTMDGPAVATLEMPLSRGRDGGAAVQAPASQFNGPGPAPMAPPPMAAPIAPGGPGPAVIPVPPEVNSGS